MPDGQNVVWGWGKISQLTSSRSQAPRDAFFNARYHVALCRFLWGKAANDPSVINKSATDITRVHALYPGLGGPEQKAKFDQLLKSIQQELGDKPVGLPESA